MALTADIDHAKYTIKIENDSDSEFSDGEKSDVCLEAKRSKFERELARRFRLSEASTYIWTRTTIAKRIEQLKNVKTALHAKRGITLLEKHTNRRYKVRTKGKIERLYFKKCMAFLQVIPMEDLFDLLHDTHNSCKVDRRAMIEIFEAQKIYMPVSQIDIYLSICRCGEDEMSVELKQFFNEKGVYNLIDLRHCPDNDFKWLLHYYHLSSDSNRLRPLVSDRPSDVAAELLKLFKKQDSPHRLNCDLGHEYNAKVLKELSKIMPRCKIDIEQFEPVPKQDIEKLLNNWMTENNSENWTFGCHVLEGQIRNPEHETDTVAESSFVCCVCNTETEGAMKCEKCNINDLIEFEDDEATVEKPRKEKGKSILDICKRYRGDLIDVGTSVTITSVPESYVSRYGINEIKGVIVNNDNGYSVGTMYGIITRKFQRNHLKPSLQMYIEEISQTPIDFKTALFKHVESVSVKGEYGVIKEEKEYVGCAVKMENEEED